MAEGKEKTRLQELYNAEIRVQLKKELNIANIMQVPKIENIVFFNFKSIILI